MKLIILLIVAVIVGFMYNKRSKEVPKSIKQMSVETGVEVKHMNQAPQAVKKKLDMHMNKANKRLEDVEE